jgi:hypothetical protein
MLLEISRSSPSRGGPMNLKTGGPFELKIQPSGGPFLVETGIGGAACASARPMGDASSGPASASPPSPAISARRVSAPLRPVWPVSIDASSCSARNRSEGSCVQAVAARVLTE